MLSTNHFPHFDSGAFREIVDINIIGAMGPPGGGRNPLTPRFTRHFNLLSFCEMEDVSKKRIFSTILNSWIRKYSYNFAFRCNYILCEIYIEYRSRIGNEIII